MGAPALLTAAALTIFIHVSSRSVEKNLLWIKEPTDIDAARQ